MAKAQEHRKLRIMHLGRVDYEKALDLQEKYAEDIRENRASEVLLLLEHPHVLTLGYSGKRDNILVSDEELRRREVKIYTIRRGGDVTYHGFGQLVGYPILRFKPGDRGVKRLVRTLEDVLIRTLEDFSITAARKDNLIGVWVGDDKIASIGVGISRWTSRHGFALNINTDLSYFDLIVPCGHQGISMTSMARILGKEIPMQEVIDRLTFHFLQCFKMEADPT
ncbi:lipoyl(octanoyl) transferase LipB [Acidobacteriota bacterium]